MVVGTLLYLCDISTRPNPSLKLRVFNSAAHIPLRDAVAHLLDLSLNCTSRKIKGDPVQYREANMQAMINYIGKSMVR